MLQIYFKQQKQTPLSSREEFVLQCFPLTVYTLFKKRYFSRSEPHCSWGVRIVWIRRAGDKHSHLAVTSYIVALEELMNCIINVINDLLLRFTVEKQVLCPECFNLHH